MNQSRNILVCVTQQKTCERLILKAADLKKDLNGDLFIIHVAKNEWNFLDNAKEGEALEYLFSISKSVGANLAVLRSEDIVNSIAAYARENNIGCIILGESPNDHKENRFFKELGNILYGVDIRVIPQVDF